MDLSRRDVPEELSLPRAGRRLALNRQALALLRLGRRISPFIFLLGAFLLVHALAFIADRYAPDSSTRFLQADRQHVANILASADHLDALALGSSHTGSLQMPALGYPSGYRYARADGDLFETRYLLEALVPRLARLETVLLPISYFSFSTDNSLSAEVEVRRAHLYASLPSWRFRQGDLEDWLAGLSHAYFPILRLPRSDNWESVFYALLGRPPEVKGFVEVAPGDCSFLPPAELDASVDNRVDKYMRLTQEMNAGRPELEQEAYAAAAGMVRLLRERGIRVVLFTPPYWQGYSESYAARDPQTVARMAANLQRLQQELGVEYYDFSTDPEFATDPTLFKDSDHLNSCGAERFSAKFRQRLAAGEAAAR